jgi:DNA-binding PadR family transcriptional regulator
VGKGAYLGEFEQVVLLAAARLGEQAYGGGVHDEIVATTDRDPSVPAVYVTLARLEKKGLLVSSVDDAALESGRSRKRFSLTPSGIAALRASRTQFEQLWAGLSLEGQEVAS